MQNPTQYKIPEWFLNRQKDIVDGKYSQLLANGLDNKLREDLERLKKIRAHRGVRHSFVFPLPLGFTLFHFFRDLGANCVFAELACAWTTYQDDREKGQDCWCQQEEISFAVCHRVVGIHMLLALGGVAIEHGWNRSYSFTYLFFSCGFIVFLPKIMAWSKCKRSSLRWNHPKIPTRHRSSSPRQYSRPAMSSDAEDIAKSLVNAVKNNHIPSDTSAILDHVLSENSAPSGTQTALKGMIEEINGSLDELNVASHSTQIS